MENKTLNAGSPNMEFHVGKILAPLNWEIAVLVDNIGAVELQLEKNVSLLNFETPVWKSTGTGDKITANGSTVFRCVGGGHFRLVPSGTPLDVFVSISY